VILPGSRTGEALRPSAHICWTQYEELRKRFRSLICSRRQRASAKPPPLKDFGNPSAALSIKVIENDTWDCIGHADLALAASGTVTVEAAVLGTPMVTFYRVNSFSWLAGRRLVKVPFLSMVNLIAERQIVPELIQHDMTAAGIAREAEELLTDVRRADRMRLDLSRVRKLLTKEGDPFERAANVIERFLEERPRTRVPVPTVIRRQ
jgi:lipid-A-disaccharide synthase